MNRTFKYVVVSLSTLVVALLLIGAVLGQSTESNGTEPYRHLNVYTEVLAKIKSDYVEDPDMKSVTLGAINGLLVSVDPFASYLNADQYKAWLKVKDHAKASVGLVLSRKYGYEIGVVDSIPGSPADKAGIATGDMVESINGISTRDMPLAYAEVMLEGEPNSTVELTVLRLSKAKPTKMTLTRTTITVPGSTSKQVEAGIGYVQVQDLSAGKVAEVAGKIKDLEKQGAKKLILDLRHSTVGDPDEGVALASLFLEKGTIGSVSGQHFPKKTFEADPAKVVWKGPLVVLTNRGTIGAAEVAAAALLENQRASVVGERTYGDAAVRKPVSTEDGGAVLLAVAKYYTPGGKAIQEASVTPTYPVMDNEPEVAMDDEEPVPTPAPNSPVPDKPGVVAPKNSQPAKPAEDLILKKALDVLNGKATQQASNKGAAGGQERLGTLNVPASVEHR